MVCIFGQREFRELMHEDLVHQIKKRFLAGNLKIVGHTPIPEEVPASEQSENPARPDLSLCAWASPGANSTLRVPDSVAEKWAAYPRFGDAYNKWQLECKVAGLIDAEPGDTLVPPPPPEKSRRLSDPPAEVPVKQEPETPSLTHTSPVGTLADPSFDEVPMGRDGLALRNSSDGVWALFVNRTSTELKLETGTVVAGYYK